MVAPDQTGPHSPALRSVGRLSERARRAGAAYAGPGSGPGPVEGPAPIGFTSGLPDPTLLPAGTLAEATASVLGAEANAALQYGGAQGWQGLRRWLSGHGLDRDVVELSPEHYCLANGSAGALANICETFLDAGDVAGVESLSFPLSVRTIRSITPRIEAIPVDADGVVVDALEERLEALASRGERMRLFYAIPTFHNPTGSLLTLERRQKLVEVCRRHDVLLVEDDAYGELWFGDPPPTSLYALAAGEGVIKVGSFSKILAPGLRAGWCQAPPPVIAALVATRCDMGTSPLLLRVVERLGVSGFLDEHIAHVRGIYAHKSEVLQQALTAACGGLCRWTTPAGGFFLWVAVAEEVDPLVLGEAARDEGVTFVGGHIFSSEQAGGEGPRLPWGPGDSRSLRLAFSYVSEEEIVEGARRLGRAMARATGRGSANREAGSPERTVS
ncbi:MAG: PLP-dependent aminotransferase family protein [Acidimicrobiales bacterium]|nr:PLP-dependent aminotransferase family protein [Acidimicrobiales bacterium]